jgi:hypothetical protein
LHTEECRKRGHVTRLIAAIVLTSAPLLVATPAAAQQPAPVPAPVQRAANDVEDAAERFGIGVIGGIGLDPELIEFGGHARFGPIFRPGLIFRPGIDFGLGEVTTSFGINLDVLYHVSRNGSSWAPYFGAGPNFALSHRGFEADIDDIDHIDDGRNRFDFGDTDFVSGFNFIAGARRANGMFFELRATAYGVSNVKLLAGYNF